MPRLLIFSFFLTILIITAPLNFQTFAVQSEMAGFEGMASWYGFSSPGINRKTANMEIFDQEDMTCAMWRVPFNTILKVTNWEGGRSVYVRVNDRGPAKRLVKEGRIIDLTKGAFQRIADLRKGLIRVRVEIIDSAGYKERLQDI